jgi:CheY-like chemotaxis protein
MGSEFVILLVEDDPDDACDYKQDIEASIDVTVISVTPPEELSDLAAMVAEYDASAVVLDERLQQRSSATYVGIDALEYLRNAVPQLPMYILTNYPHSSELKGRGLLAENLIRKRDFDDDEDFRQSYLQELYQRIRHYHKEPNEGHPLPAPGDTVTKDFVEGLAQLHFEADEGVEQIAWFRTDEGKEIHLIEINRTALPSDSIQVFRFAPSEEVPFPMLIADVRPSEWERVQSGEIPLPEGWEMEEIEMFQRTESLTQR